MRVLKPGNCLKNSIKPESPHSEELDDGDVGKGVHDKIKKFSLWGLFSGQSQIKVGVKPSKSKWITGTFHFSSILTVMVPVGLK